VDAHRRDAEGGKRLHLISTRTTFFLKFVLPIGYSAFLAAASPFLMKIAFSPGRMPGWAATLELVCMLYPWLAISLWYYAGLKRVRMDDVSLYISNYRREIVVPLVNVSRLTMQPPVWRGGRVQWIIHFLAPTEFGSAVSFRPALGSFSGPEYPAVDRLRRARDHARRGAGPKPRRKGKSE
jgi:hypothetical protein